MSVLCALVGCVCGVQSAGPVAGGAVAAGSLTWDSASLGPDIQLYGGNLGVTRTNSNGWGIQRASSW